VDLMSFPTEQENDSNIDKESHLDPPHSIMEQAKAPTAAASVSPITLHSDREQQSASTLLRSDPKVWDNTHVQPRRALSQPNSKQQKQSPSFIDGIVVEDGSFESSVDIEGKRGAGTTAVLDLIDSFQDELERGQAAIDAFGAREQDALEADYAPALLTARNNSDETIREVKVKRATAEFERALGLLKAKLESTEKTLNEQVAEKRRVEPTQLTFVAV